MIMLALALGATTTPPAKSQVALDCVVLNPQREQKSVLIEWIDGPTPKAKATFTIADEGRISASRIIRMEDGAADPKRIIRQYYVEGGQGPLVFRVIREGESDWGLDIAPAGWSFVSGPIASGRCIRKISKSTDLISLGDRAQLPNLTSSLRSPAVDVWNLSAVQKNCALISAGNRIHGARISIDAKGNVKFFDPRKGTFLGEFGRGLVASEGAHVVKYNEVKVRLGRDTIAMSLTYRQGRFWIDGHQNGSATPSSWFRGTCIEKTLSEIVQ